MPNWWGFQFCWYLGFAYGRDRGWCCLSREYLLMAKTSDVSSAARGTSITVASEAYTVRENRPVDDGLFSELLLSKD